MSKARAVFRLTPEEIKVIIGVIGIASSGAAFMATHGYIFTGVGGWCLLLLILAFWLKVYGADETMKQFNREWDALKPSRKKAAEHLLKIRGIHDNSSDKDKPINTAMITGDKNVEAVLSLLQYYCARHCKWRNLPVSEQSMIFNPLLAYCAATKELLIEDHKGKTPKYQDILTIHDAYLKAHPEIKRAKDHLPDTFLFGEKTMT